MSIKLKEYTPNPTTVDNTSDLESKLIENNNGKIYEYSGSTSGDYWNGDFYEVYELAATLDKFTLDSDLTSLTIITGA